MKYEINGEKELNEKWYQVKYWNETGRFPSPAVALVKSADHSEPYESDSQEIFKLKDGQFALVLESGCSCYDAATDADIELYPDLTKAKEAWNKALTYESGEYRGGWSALDRV
jgi:hypothetical protein